MKNLKDLGKILSRNEQKQVNGGMLTVAKIDCSKVCLTASNGHRCYETPSCLFICDGNGGYDRA